MSDISKQDVIQVVESVEMVVSLFESEGYGDLDFIKETKAHINKLKHLTE